MRHGDTHPHTATQGNPTARRDGRSGYTQFEEEEEGPSYLADLKKAPDFVDEAPVEQTEVKSNSPFPMDENNNPLLTGAGERSCEDKRII